MDAEKPARGRASSFITPISSVVFVVAMWIAGHPYKGVEHDARLYMVQALHALDPARWNSDLFFKYGTQDAFTVFTKVYAPVVAALGLEPAHVLFTVVGQGLWLGALFALAWAMFETKAQRWAAVAGATLLAGSYGSAIWSYAEPFATPRLFAEAATLGGLALALRGRWVAAILLVGLGLALHPLIAIYGFAVLALYVAQKDRWAWLVIGAAALSVGAGIALKIGPLARAWSAYDDLWWVIVQVRFPFALMGKWSIPDWLTAISALGVLGAFITFADSLARRLAVGVAITAIAGLAVSLAGADRAHNVLVANLQLWRGMWLATVLANMVLPLLMLRSKGAARWLLGAAIIVSVTARFLFSLAVIVPVFILAGCLMFTAGFMAQRRAGSFMATFARVDAFVVAGLGVAAAAALLTVQFGRDVAIWLHLAELGLGLLAAAGLAISVRRPPWRWAPMAACALVVTAAALVDQRTAWERYVYGIGPDGGLSAFLANAGNIYWVGDRGGEAVWFKARRPSYYSCMQGSEAIFFRGEALDWLTRNLVLRNLDDGDFGHWPWCGLKAHPAALGPTSRSQLTAVCRAAPDLDTLVLDRPVPGAAGASWTAPAFIDQATSGRPAPVSRFFRYDCAAFR